MGFERNYQVRIPAKQLIIKAKMSSLPSSNLQLSSPMKKEEPAKSAEVLFYQLNPWFLTGFADAEGCFSIKITKNDKLKTKWRVRPVFSITLHLKDLSLLTEIKNTLKVGNISKSGKKAVIYSVDSIKEIPVIINHFNQYPLITNKLSDYLIFKNCFDIIKQGEHLNEEGLLKIVALKNSLNKGLPENLIIAFPNTSERGMLRPEYLFKEIPDPFWLSGFVSGEGSFHVVISKSNKEIFTRFSIHLHIRDLNVLKGINTQFNKYNPEFSSSLVNLEPALPSIEGRASKNKVLFFEEKRIYRSENSVQIQIKKQSDIFNTIIPFFNEYPLLGCKSLDFEDFKKVSYLLKTYNKINAPANYCKGGVGPSNFQEILDKILEIKSGMNLNRK